jgi:hypothetical protein
LHAFWTNLEDNILPSYKELPGEERKMRSGGYPMTKIGVALLLLMAVALSACTPPEVESTSSPQATSLTLITSTPTPTGTTLPSPEPTDTPASSPTVAVADTANPTATAVPSPLPPTATPSPTPLVVRVEPTFTPRPGDERARVGELPLGEPGHYVNVTFGYWVQYPPNWFTGFGNRPLLVSFSDLDPGSHNRNSMRAGGCLIEINAATNIYGFTFEGIMSQLPQSFPDAQRFELDGQPALRVRHSSGENPFDSEVVYVEHDHRLLLITFEYAREAGDLCRPVWENMLGRWQWFTPQFAVYRNTDFGYAVSHPRSWYRFDSAARGISISSLDPSGATDLLELAKGAMLVETTVLDNPDGVPLKEWLAAQEWQLDLTNDIPLDGIVGVRVLREGPSPEIQEMSGYYQGPLGKIYVVRCLYPVARQKGFRPIANAIIHSFEF